MADEYVDIEDGNDANTGADWANAELLLQTGLTDSGAGGRVFVRTDSGATGEDTAAAARTLTGSSDYGNPNLVVGCKSSVTADPPAEADIAVRGTDNLPIWRNTGTGTINMAGNLRTQAMRIVADQRLAVAGGSLSIWEAFDCEILWDEFVLIAGAKKWWRWTKCDIGPQSTTQSFIHRDGAIIEIYGSTFAAAAANAKLIDGSTMSGILDISSSDLSDLHATLNDAAHVIENARIKIKNCQVPSSWTTNAPLNSAEIEIIGSSDGGAATLGSSASAQSYHKKTAHGSVDEETTVIRTTGGASDGASGAFSYALTPASGDTLETSHNELTSPWIRGWVDGDGTSQTITVHGAGVASLLDDDAYLEVHAPSEDGSYKYTMYESTRSYISDNASALTAGDSWSGSPAATYKFEITIAPDYDGPVYARVHYHKRSTDAFYVDPILVVS